MRPLYPSRRSVSNAASAAAPPPRMTIDAGVPAEDRRAARDGNSWRPRTKCLPSMVSTDQQATGFNAGARTASPVRMLKQA